jgi:hypothetical protein
MSWRRGGEGAGPGPSPLGNLSCGPARPALSPPSVLLATQESKSLQGEALRDSRQHIVIGRLAGDLTSRVSLGRSRNGGWQRPRPGPAPFPGAALNVGPRAPPAQLAAAISAVSEQLRGGLGGPALRPVSSSGSLCHGLGLGVGRAVSGRVSERWVALLSRPQFPLMGGRAPSPLQVARSWRPGLSLLHGARGVYCPNWASCAQAVRLSLSPGVPALPQISLHDRAADGDSVSERLPTLQSCPIKTYIPGLPTQDHEGPDSWGAWGLSPPRSRVSVSFSFLVLRKGGRNPWDPPIVTHPIRYLLAIV